MACPLGLAAALHATFGPKGLILFCGQAAGSIILLEVPYRFEMDSSAPFHPLLSASAFALGFDCLTSVNTYVPVCLNGCRPSTSSSTGVLSGSACPTAGALQLPTPISFTPLSL